MAKERASYICQNCGAVSTRWAGRCEACAEWNTLAVEGGAARGAGGGFARKKQKTRREATLETLADGQAEPARLHSAIAEFDRAAGGGLAPASVVLIGGEPGIGKSTLVLQIMAGLAARGEKRPVVYVSGEESANQVRLRAHRLGLSDAPLKLVAETALMDILNTLKDNPPIAIAIDSIQTMWLDDVDAAPGTITQLRAATQNLIHFAKSTGAACCLIGHVTKDGQIAGPRVIAHMVDAVFHFDSDGGHHFRILRAVKNRFGPTDEIGVFEMGAEGLAGVANPSAFFLSARDEKSSGSAVFAGIEGTRPLLSEIQALVVPTTFGTPRRASVGCDPQRLSMILAVLEARAGIAFSGHDVYLNVAGGLRITDPAGDLAVAAALISAVRDRALQPDGVFFGEISLSGVLRPAQRAEARLREAAKLGFRTAWLPQTADTPRADKTITCNTLRDLDDLCDIVPRAG